ncbi:SIR2 family protein [Aquibacillus kalidii]|uniref:SIR2 family protein n=1 Tax=Aquibacillus kalidii TaxID=2762597 RepID=UPI001C9A224E|nr:SIR2 family protein [Aquibacillus kalidii]
MEENDFEMLKRSKLFVGSKDWVHEFLNENPNNKSAEKLIDKIRLMLKNYLQLDNVNFLFGTGSSLHLGTTSIRNFPKQIENAIEHDGEIYTLFTHLVKQYQNSDDILRDEESQSSEIKVPLEEFLDYLLALQYVEGHSRNLINGFEYDDFFGKTHLEITTTSIEKLINMIKSELFKLCDLDSLEYYPPEDEQTSNEMKRNGKYTYHNSLIKSLLQRPLNLRRANIFTTNYDLAFENTFEELGVHYMNGFSGFHNRTFKPEVYDYDLYYPGNTTEGRVRRVERMIRYFKLHGSLTWIRESNSAQNQYGLVEKDINWVRANLDAAGDIIIYPTAHKKGYTLDFPYSELFRQFASAITQPQSVLFCIGYSFFDEHVNDIIYQALSIPSFTLIIVDFNGTKNKVINKLYELDDPRIIILEGPYLGDFKTFSKKIIPNFHEIESREKIAASLQKLYSGSNETESEVENDARADNW